MGLILQHQLNTRSSELLEELLLQTEVDPIVSEREIYRRAAQEDVIDSSLSRKLEELYSKRNRVVHRPRKLLPSALALPTDARVLAGRRATSAL